MNPLVRETTCLRPPVVSVDGSTAVFEAARGRFDAAGELEFDGFDGWFHGPVVHRLASGVTTSLASADIVFDDPQLQAALPIHYGVEIADDGSRVAVRTAFLPDDYIEGAVIEFTVGILLLHRSSGKVEVVGRHTDRRAFCLRCFATHAEDMVLSGDGSVLWYLRAIDQDSFAQQLPLKSARLNRHDVANVRSIAAPIDDAIDNGSLVTNGDGSRVAYLAEGRVVVIDLERGEWMTLDRALRGCTDSRCEFDNYRFVRDSPLTFSADGGTLLISVIPEHTGADEPQNAQEIMLLDVEQRTVQRLAPNVDIIRVASGDDGQLIVFETDDVGLISEMAWMRHFHPALEKHFVVVHWDHRGAATSCAAADWDAITPDQFVEDTGALIERLLVRLERESLILVGNSWGSILGVRVAARWPDRIAAYVGVTQQVNVRETDLLGWQRTLERAQAAGNEKDVERLETQGPPPYPEEDFTGHYLRLIRLQDKYGGTASSRAIGSAQMSVAIRAPEYSWWDLVNFFRGMLKGWTHVYSQLLDLDLELEVAALEMPVFLFLSRDDITVPPDPAVRWLANLEAPDKRVIWFDDAGHTLTIDARTRFDEVLIEEVRPVAVVHASNIQDSRASIAARRC